MKVVGLLDQPGDAVRVRLIQADRRAVEGEDRGFLELAGDLLPDEEAVVLLVHVHVKVVCQLVVPVGLEPDRIEDVEPSWELLDRK